jgi:hypothetical protein
MSNLKSAKQSFVKNLVGFEPRDVFLIKIDLARRGGKGAGNDVEKRGLPGAIGSDQTGDGTFGNLERNSIQGVDSSEELMDVLDTKHREEPSGRGEHAWRKPGTDKFRGLVKQRINGIGRR